MNNAGGDNIFVMLNVMLVVFAIFYFITIRPRRKKEKEIEQMRNDLKVGDIVTTIGGIIGIVVSIKEDGLTLETGSDKNKIRIKKWAIQSVEKIEVADKTAVEEKTKNVSAAASDGLEKVEKADEKAGVGNKSLKQNENVAKVK